MITLTSIRTLFQDFEKQRLLRLPSVPFTINDLEWSEKLAQAFRRSGYRQYECSRGTK